MEMEYRDPRRRGRFLVIIGLIFAILAGAGAFMIITQAQQQAGQGSLQHVSIVVAKLPIPARKPIEAADVEVRDVPVDATNAQGVFADPVAVIGLVAGVNILAGQPIYANLLASSSQGGQFSILSPDETISPTSEAWRAVSVTVPDDRAVAGMIAPGDTVDVFVSISVAVPETLAVAGRYYSEKSTKIIYQNLVVLAKATNYYVLRVPEALAEEISHLQATGAAAFSFALRPIQDTRMVDAGVLGQTTNRIIQRYGMPVPEVFPPGLGPIPTPQPTPTPDPATPTGAGSSPNPSTGASASPSTSP
jgi:Flp pilus assembly protein CpaB